LKRIDKPADELKIGQEVEAEVVGLEPENHKISLSIKKLLKPEATDAAEDAVVEVDASEVEDAVELED
jgi:ribosomal protein S1